MSRLCILLFVYTADLLPFSSQESTYLIGSKRVRGGPTVQKLSWSAVKLWSGWLLSSFAKIHAHTLEEIGIVFKACCRGSNSIFRAFLFNQVLTEATNHVSFCQLELFCICFWLQLHQTSNYHRCHLASISDLAHTTMCNVYVLKKMTSFVSARCAEPKLKH